MAETKDWDTMVELPKKPDTKEWGKGGTKPPESTPEEKAALEERRRQLEAQWNRSQAAQVQKERASAAKEAEDVYKKLGIESPTEREKTRGGL